MFSREAQAEEVAVSIARYEDTGITVDDVEQWGAEAVCEWIEKRGFIWDSKTYTWIVHE